MTTPEIVSEWLLPTDLKPEAGAKFGFAIRAKDSRSMRGACGRCRAIDPLFLARRRGATRRARLHRHLRDRGDPAGGTHLTIVHEVRYAVPSARRRHDRGKRQSRRADAACRLTN